MVNNQRIDYLNKKIEREKANPVNGIKQIPWQGGELPLPIILVEKDFLRYRLENGRTQRKQLEYMEKNKDDKIFSDAESERAQQAQHEILLEMVDQEGLKDDILNSGLREPLIITRDGYVLNGNRRLAAVRKFTDKEFVKCVVLPEVSPKDLYDLELDLQMAKEMKADYNWVDELLTIRKGLEVHKENDVILAKKMRTSKAEVNQKLNMLKLVDLYLNWLNAKGKYFKIGDKDEQVFIELEKFTRGNNNFEKQKLAREIVYSILQNPPEAERLYKHVRRFFRNFDQSLIMFKKKYLPNNTAHDKKENYSGKSLIDQLASVEDLLSEDKIISDIAPRFCNPENAKDNIKNLLECSEDIEALLLEKKDRNSSFNKVSDVQRTLQSIIISSETANKDGIKNKLKEIIDHSNFLISQIEKNIRR